MTSKRLTKQSKEQKTFIKLPYLQKSNKPRHSTKDSGVRQPTQFNLSTSNSKLPSYNPESDHNLKLFFQKPLNKKLIQRMKEQRPSRKSQYKPSQSSETRTQILRNKINQTNPYQNRSQNISAKRINTVTSHQFLNYLENIRKRILSSEPTHLKQQSSTKTSIG